jgi:competence protein ComEA
MRYLYALIAAMALGSGFVMPVSAAEVVNINTADAATLSRELKGIGTTRAQAIVEYRRKNGPFRSVDELALVKGIGPKVIEQNRELIRVEQRRPGVASAPRAGGNAPKPR